MVTGESFGICNYLSVGVSRVDVCIKGVETWSCLRADECAEVLCPGL